MNIKITTKKRGEIEAVQRKFKNQLSESVILKSTAQAINGALKKGITNKQSGVKASIAAGYNINKKYVDRAANVNPKATAKSLWGGIELGYKPVPMIAFNPQQTKTGIGITIHKGKKETVPSAFLATMKSGHVGVFSRGRVLKKAGYVPTKGLPEGKGAGKQRTKSGKVAIGERVTASPHGMATSTNVAPKIAEFIGREALRATEGILQRRVSELIK